MLAPFLFAAVAAACPIAHAQYQVRGDPGVTARFRSVARTPDWQTGIALQVHVAKSGRSYWFLPWQGGTDGRTNLAWVREKLSPIQYQPVRRDLQFFAANAAYDIAPAIPNAGDSAPARLLLPDLTRLAWLSTTDLTRDSIPVAFFDLKTCKVRVSAETTPQIEFPAVP